jgi:formylglycine-generating enzyme required for sulfatase activity
VTLTRSFYIGIHEVTQGQYAAVMGRNPSFFKGSARPVERVSWHDCQVFLRKLNEHERTTGGLPDGWNYRLPTDAEWEYCCRAGSQTSYCFGSGPKQLGEYAWFRDNSGKTARNRQTHDVGRKKPNAWGLYDMHGNVREWCEDRYEAGKVPPGGDATDPVGPETGSLRPVRGGDWASVAEFCRAASKSGHGPGDTIHALGLRVVLAPAGTSGSR